jgi:hypothetical protein
MFKTACNMLAEIAPSHYSSPERIASILDKLGKQKAAAYLRNKLPQSPKIRSGDLGEIIATQYIDECTIYDAPIKKLRWKDHREMSMRGDDIIGVVVNEGNGEIKFLKGEIKSRASLSTGVVEEAREALNNYGGLPSPHSLSFISDRLYEMGQDELAYAIIVAQINDGISDNQVEHLLFAFCGNDPATLLKTDLDNYHGLIRQIAVGLRVNKHQEFIAEVFNTIEDLL